MSLGAAHWRRGGRARDAPDRPGRRAGLPDHAADADHPGLREVRRRRPRTRRGRQRRVGALGDERRDRRGARGRAHDHRHVLAGPRADGRGRLHRRLDARADRDGARQPRALRPDQHPLRPLRLDADPRLRCDPALRRERAGGIRPDGHGAADRRASRTCSCRCSSAWTGSRSRTRPSRSSCSRTTRFAPSSATTASRIPFLDVGAPDDAGPVRDAGLLLRVPAPAGGRARGRAGRR